MAVRNLAIAASAFAVLAVGPYAARAQGRVHDRVDVNLPYAVTLGDTTLQPGDYTIRELRSINDERVLLIYSDNGKKYETTVMTVPAYDNRTPDDTKVVLHHYGPDYYFDKIWIAGKNYGYEFPVPANVKERQREREGPISVAATYQPPTAETAAAAPAPAEPAPTPQPAPEAQAAPPAPSTPPPPPANEETAQNTPPPQENAQQNTANREAQQTPNKLPSTSADWLTMLLVGGTLSSIGLALRRKLL